YVDAVDVRRRQTGARARREILDKVQRPMRITAGRETLEIVAADPPGLAEVGGRARRSEGAAVDVAHARAARVRLAGETGVAQSERLVAGARAVAAVDVAYRSAVIERLAACGDTERRCDVCRPRDRRGIVAAQFAQREGGGQRPVRAVRMYRMARPGRAPQPGARPLGGGHPRA